MRTFTAGIGRLDKNTDIILASVALTANIFALFINPTLGMFVSACGDIIPEVIVLLSKGWIC